MSRVTTLLFVAMLWPGWATSEESDTATEPLDLDLDTTSTHQGTGQPVKYETITVYESKVFPGFRTCTPEDYRNKDHNPIACRDDEAARVLSTREEGPQTGQIIKDDAVPQGNIYKLRFERFKREKK